MHNKVQPIGMTRLHRREMPKTAKILTGQKQNKDNSNEWVVLTHNDGDALGCIAVLEETIKPKRYFYTNYADLDKQLQNIIDYVKLYKIYNVVIPDVSLANNRDKLIELIRELKKINSNYKLQIFDHHLYDENYWNGVQAEVHHDLNKCACKILFNYYSKKYNLFNLIPLIDILNTFDIWLKDDPKFLEALIFNEFFLNFKQNNNSRIVDFYYLLKANNYQYNAIVGNYKQQVLADFEQYRKNALERGTMQKSKSGVPITIVTSWDYFNFVVYSEHKIMQDVVVGIQRNIFRVRVRKNAFSDKALGNIRKQLCGTDNIGHNLAFSYRIEKFTESEDIINEIKHLTKVFNEHRFE